MAKKCNPEPPERPDSPRAPPAQGATPKRMVLAGGAPFEQAAFGVMGLTPGYLKFGPSRPSRGGHVATQTGFGRAPRGLGVAEHPRGSACAAPTSSMDGTAPIFCGIFFCVLFVPRFWFFAGSHVDVFQIFFFFFFFFFLRHMFILVLFLCGGRLPSSAWVVRV